MKQEEKTERTRARIIAAAMTEFSAKGYTGASMNTICSSGISKGLLYHNFDGKDDLYLTCAEQCFRALTEYLKRADTGTSLQKYAEARMAFFRENSSMARLFFELVLQPPVKLKPQIAECRASFDDYNRQLFRNILRTVTLRPNVTEESALHYFSVMQEMFNSYYNSNMDEHESEMLKWMDYMLYGVAEMKPVKEKRPTK